MKYRLLAALVAIVLAFVLWTQFGQEDVPQQQTPASQSDGLFLK